MYKRPLSLFRFFIAAFYWQWLVALFIFIVLIRIAPAREVTDQVGRTVQLPEKISKVFGSAPPITYLIYALDPTLLAGVNLPLNPADKPYLSPAIHHLPVLGGWHGQGRTPNIEMLLNAKPDLAVLWANHFFDLTKHEAELNKINLPAVAIKLDALSDYPAAFLLMGDLLQRQDRARQLNAYWQDTLQAVNAALEQAPENERLAVYYAQGAEGLNTDCDQSFHAEVINRAGGRNVYRCAPRDLFGMEAISLEQVIAFNPQAIVAQEKDFYQKVLNDPRWATIDAIKNRRVYLAPRKPINWLDRPPSFMRILGVKWLTHQLYPKAYPIDLHQEVKGFYRLFLNVELSDAQAWEILKP